MNIRHQFSKQRTLLRGKKDDFKNNTKVNSPRDVSKLNVLLTELQNTYGKYNRTTKRKVRSLQLQLEIQILISQQLSE